jgi:hypothetical protein
MKGLKKIALCSAVALAPFAANAELKALDDTAMGSVTGQAGVTIDISNTRVDIGEIAYQDQGFLALSGVKLGGESVFDDADASSDFLDDIRLTIDVAGTDIDLGAPAPATAYLSSALGAGYANINSTDATVDDGDLVISLRSQTAGQAVDFGLGIENVELGAQSSTVGDIRSGTGTVLVSNLEMTGQIGPIDIVIDGSSNNMNINAFFNAQGDLTLPFMNTSMGFKLHNNRGESFALFGADGFAHAQVDINAGTTGLSVDVTDFSGDLDLTDITFGTSPSIGNLYMTDLKIQASMEVYGHGAAAPGL